MSTQPDQTERCFRCNELRESSRWEYGWPLHGQVTCGFDSQLFAALAGSSRLAGEREFAFWRNTQSVPWMPVHEAQEVRFKWGNGGPYLCTNCQAQFLGILGRFFLAAYLPPDTTEPPKHQAPSEAVADYRKELTSPPRVA